MTKVVYNRSFGGFGLSPEAEKMLAELKGMDYCPEACDLKRTDKDLVEVVESLGALADGRSAKLWIRDLEPGTRYRIDEYDGRERVVTIDEYEWSVA